MVGISSREDDMPFGDPLSGGGVEGGFGGALYGMGSAAAKKIGGLFGGLQKRPGLAQPGQQQLAVPAAPKANIDPYGSQRGFGEASSPAAGDFAAHPAPPVAASAPSLASPPKTQRPIESSAKMPGAEMHPLLEDALKNRSMWRDAPGSSYTQPTVSAPLLTLDSTWGGLDSMMSGAPTNKWVSLGQASSGGGSMSRGPAGAPGANMAKGFEAQAALEHAKNSRFPTMEQIPGIRAAQGLPPIPAENTAFPQLAAAASQPGFDATKMAKIAGLGEVDLNNPEHRKLLGSMAAQHDIDPNQAAAGPSWWQRNVWGRSPETIQASKFWQDFNKRSQGSGAGVP